MEGADGPQNLCLPDPETGGWVGRGRAQGRGPLTNSPGATPRSSPYPGLPEWEPQPGDWAPMTVWGHYAQPSATVAGHPLRRQLTLSQPNGSPTVVALRVAFATVAGHPPPQVPHA